MKWFKDLISIIKRMLDWRSANEKKKDLDAISDIDKFVGSVRDED